MGPDALADFVALCTVAISQEDTSLTWRERTLIEFRAERKARLHGDFLDRH